MIPEKKIMDKNVIRSSILREIRGFGSQAGQLPSKKNFKKYKNVGALWVISGGGSYFSNIIESPSDRLYSKYRWYCGQDKARLDYAIRWLDRFAKVYRSSSPLLIYNGTKRQNADLSKAIRDGSLEILPSNLYIAPGEIARTLDQVKKFSFPPTFRPENSKLALLSHSAHLPRVLRFINKYPKAFKGVEIVPISINVDGKKDQQEMINCEIENILGYISRGQASVKPYPFKSIKAKKSKAVIKISPVSKKDVKEIFELSNQSSIRAASFNPNKIKLAEHKKWFLEKIKDKNVIMLKASFNKKVVGQVRLDIEGNEAVIGVSVSEDFRGRGVASKLLRIAIKKARDNSIKTINAFIKPSNLASIGLFEKNGWVIKKREAYSGKPANKYVYKVQKNENR